MFSLRKNIEVVKNKNAITMSYIVCRCNKWYPWQYKLKLKLNIKQRAGAYDLLYCPHIYHYILRSPFSILLSLPHHSLFHFFPSLISSRPSLSLICTTRCTYLYFTSTDMRCRHHSHHSHQTINKGFFNTQRRNLCRVYVIQSLLIYFYTVYYYHLRIYLQNI